MTSQHQAFHLGGGGQPPSSSNANLPVHDPRQAFNVHASQNNTSAVPSATPQHQQMAFGQNAALPSLDMSVLQGITPQQLALIAQLIQTGALPLPPSAPSTQLPATTGSSVAAERTQSSGEVDREDGELDEGEVSDQQPRDFLTAPPKGPRRRSRSPVAGKKRARGSGAHTDGQSTSRGGSGQASNTAAPLNAPRGPSALNNAQSHARASNGGMNNALATSASTRKSPGPSTHAAMKEFILEMHQAGYGFDQMAKEVGNTMPLRRLYASLNLAVSAVDSEKEAQVKTTLSPTVSEQPPAVAATTATKRPPTKPAAADRNAYLAKLQAAKNKKSESAASAPSKKSEVGAVQAAAVAHSNQRASDIHNAPPTPQPAPPKVVVNTELVRQRLQALNAARAQKAAQPPLNEPVSATVSAQQHSASNTLPLLQSAASADAIVSTKVALPDVSVGRSHLPAGIGGLPSTTAAQQFPTSASPSLGAGFGLPGLFTTRSPVAPASQSPAQVSTIAQTPTGEPRPAAAIEQTSSSYALSVPSPKPAVQPQPFGQVITPYDSESFIIEASSDEEGDGEETQAPTKAKQSLPGLLQDFPPKVSAFKVTTSAPGTPGTPGVDLKRKLEELEEMKRKLARIETKKSKSATTAQGVRTASGHSSAPPSTSNSGSVTPSKAVQPKALADSSNSIQAEPSKPTTPLKATSVKLKAAEQEKEILRRRLLELQAQGVDISPATRALAEPSLPRTDLQNNISQQNGTDLEAAEVEDDEMGEADFYGTLESDTPDGNATSEETHPDHDNNHAVSNEATASASQGSSAGLANATHGELSDAHANIQETAVDPAAPAPTDHDVYEPELYNDDDDMDDIYEPQPDSEPLPTLDTVPSISGSGDATEAEDQTEGEIQVSVTSNVSSTDDDDDADDYEPSQEIAATNEPAAPSPASTDAMSESVSMSESEASTSGDESASASPAGDLANGQASVSELHTEAIESSAPRIVNDGLAPELQPTQEQHVVAEQQPQAVPGWYKPYTSPLYRFKDFRFHPSFLSTIPGGHKSLTYTHNIDPVKQLCPFEMNGRCNDKDCSFQHFKSMTLSDNDLLRILGTERMPANDPETEKKWREGLTAVIKELRNTVQTQDVAAIAQRIAEFRREFIGDPTKTLLLKDT